MHTPIRAVAHIMKVCLGGIVNWKYEMHEFEWVMNVWVAIHFVDSLFFGFSFTYWYVKFICFAIFFMDATLYIWARKKVDNSIFLPVLAVLSLRSSLFPYSKLTISNIFPFFSLMVRQCVGVPLYVVWQTPPEWAWHFAIWSSSPCPNQQPSTSQWMGEDQQNLLSPSEVRHNTMLLSSCSLIKFRNLVHKRGFLIAHDHTMY